MAYEVVTDLDSLGKAVEDLAARISAPTEELPTYRISHDGARPHIEHDDRGFHYVVVERGRELRRVTSFSVDEVLYNLFQSITFTMACSYELKNRLEKRDCRRMIWQRQLELLGQLDNSWPAIRKTEISNILAKHPFDDLASIRATLAGELRKQGFSPEVASAKAYETYPKASITK